MAEPVIRPATWTERLGNINLMDVARAGLQGALLGSPSGPVGAGISGLGAAAETAFPGAGPQDIQQGMIPTAKNLKEFLGRMSSSLFSISRSGVTSFERGAAKIYSSPKDPGAYNNQSLLATDDPRTIALAYMQARYPIRTNLVGEYQYLPSGKHLINVSTPNGKAAAQYRPIPENGVDISGMGGRLPEGGYDLAHNSSIGFQIENLAHEQQHARQDRQFNFNRGGYDPVVSEQQAYRANDTAAKGFQRFFDLMREQFPDMPNKRSALIETLTQHRPLNLR